MISSTEAKAMTKYTEEMIKIYFMVMPEKTSYTEELDLTLYFPVTDGTQFSEETAAIPSRHEMVATSYGSEIVKMAQQSEIRKSPSMALVMTQKISL